MKLKDVTIRIDSAMLDVSDLTMRLDGSSMPGPARACILLVESNLTDAERMAAGLRLAGFEVDIETDPARASERITFERFRAVVCAIDLPRSSGVDLFALARSYDKNVPFLLLIGDDSLARVTEAIKLGPTQYILKPASASHLVDVVSESVSRREMASALRDNSKHEVRAFEDAINRAYLAYQPIVSMRGELEPRIIAYEALLRSESESHGSPLRILEAAERLQRIPEVGRRVRRMAAVSAKSLQEDRLLFVNLHAMDLNDEDLFDRSTEFSKVANRIILEITEREDVTSVKNLDQRLRDLRVMGFRIAIDDLGAGYAGLSSFALLEPDYVKLDMSLVRDVDRSPVRERIVNSIVSLSSDFGIRVVGEGVETEAECNALRRLGVTFMQGYHFGKPARATVR
jgi:EAL domain-containing protein (putative c-di-GMP-specific phosphodiesterase class I)